MPLSAVHTFADPDDYAVSIRGAEAEVTVTERGKFTAKLIRIDFHRLWMQRLSENLPRVAYATHMLGRAFITFRTEAGPRLLASGLEIQPTNVLRHNQADNYHQRSSGSASFGTMSLPVEELASVGAAIGGYDLTPPNDPLIVTPSASAMARLQRLHAAAGHLAEHAPEIIANPDAARGLEQALIEAMVECLGRGHEWKNTLAQGQHAIVMRRFRRVVEENPEQPLYIPDICNAIRVSDRTLRACCQEHLGMSPKRYLLLRRMAFARQALRAAEPDAATVTDIATRYGFWQLGHFAIEYRRLFGELPSDTLEGRSL